MICHIRIECAYEVGRFSSRAQVIFLSGPHKGKATDTKILASVENGDLLHGEFTGKSIGLDMTRGEFIPLKPREELCSEYES